MTKTYIALQIQADDCEIQNILREALCENYYESPEGYAIVEDSVSRGSTEIIQIIVTGIELAAALLTIADITGLVDFIKDKLKKKVPSFKLKGKKLRYKRVFIDGGSVEVVADEGEIQLD